MLTQARPEIKSPLARVGRWLLGAALALVVLFGLVLGLIRFWAWPALPSWQAEMIADAQPFLARHGLKLTAGPVVGDWEGLLTPRIQLTEIRLENQDGEQLLVIPSASATLGWKSWAMLWRWQPIFTTIEIRDPSLAIVRDPEGEITVGGFPVNDASGDSSAADWFLRQGRIELLGGQVEWRDQKNLKSAQFGQVQLRMRNLGLVHDVDLRADPPPAMGSTFSFKGGFRHSLLGNPSTMIDWVGKADLQFDRVDLSEFFAVVKLSDRLPLQVRSGQGSLRAEFSVARGELTALTADLDLTKADLTWDKNRSPLTFETLNGRVTARIAERKQVIGLEKIRLESAQLKAPLLIADAQLDLERQPQTNDLSAEIKASSLDLAAATWLSAHLPLPANWKTELLALQPSGRLDNLILKWRQAQGLTQGFSIQTAFEDLTVTAGDHRPGFSGLSGKLLAQESHGEVTVNSAGATLVFPKVFQDPQMRADTLSLSAKWSARHLLPTADAADKTELDIEIKRLSVSNADLAAEASGSVRWPGSGLGNVNLQGRVLRAQPQRIARYLPLEVGPDAREWIKESLLESKPYTASFDLVGDLNDFPFVDPAKGRFLVKARAEAGAIRPAPGWPVIRNINAEVEFDRQQFRLLAKGARINELYLSDVNARIDDLEADQPKLLVVGAMMGDIQDVVNTVNQSPAKAMMNNISQEMQGQGQARVDLRIGFDLDDVDRSKVEGTISMSRGVFGLASSLPEIIVEKASVAFNQDGLTAVNASGQMLGGAVDIASTPRPNDRFLISLRGQATGVGLEALLNKTLGFSYSAALVGSSPYTAQIELHRSTVQARVNTSLIGLTSTLPAPFRKSQSDDWGLNIDFFQGESAQPDIAGPQRWVVSSNRQQINAQITRLAGQGKETTINLESETVAGAFTWVAAERQYQGQRSALLRARLQRLWLAARDPAEDLDQPSSVDSRAAEWPAVDAIVEDFRIGERRWGRLELEASPARNTRSWDIARFSLSNADAALSGNGQWVMLSGTNRGGVQRSRTTLNILLDLRNGGALLARAGYPNVVKATSGEIQGTVNWLGSPLQLSGSRLSGNLKLDLREGQFLKTEPGLARLVGVVNLQSLPRRIKLDFRDVFSEGFTYERIRGDLQFINGKASTQNFRIIGVQASVMLEGDADIKEETQNLRVLVLPEFNAGLASLGYAAVVNPAIGLGSFIAQYILRNPVRDFLSYEYQVTGAWDDPKVEAVKREMKSDSPEMKALE